MYYIQNYKKNIFVKIKLYNIFGDYTFTSDKINGVNKNFQYNFKNCIYKFFNRYNSYISKYNTYNYEKLKSEKIKLYNTDFINIFGFFNDVTYCKEYMNLKIYDNDISNINKKKINKSYLDEKYILINVNIESYIVDYIDSNFNLYKTFINLFNDNDKTIIKIATYGQSGCGKTHFLKNINNILLENNKLHTYSHGMYRHVNTYINSDIKYFINNNKKKLLKCINNYVIQANGYNYVIHYINLDEIVNTDFNNILKIFFEVYNKIKILDFKLILFCESYIYNDYYKDFDIVYKADYISDETKKNIEKQFNFISNLYENIKINQLITEILNS
jgi:chromosomal replication initiation ATPase DnaA